MGKCRYFVHNRFGDSRFEHLFSAFRAGYLTAIGAMFTTDLLIDLWLLYLVCDCNRQFDCDSEWRLYDGAVDDVELAAANSLCNQIVSVRLCKVLIGR